MPKSSNQSSQTKIPVSFGTVARDILFAGTLDVQGHGLVYRKGKTVEDVKAAVRKAKKPKNGFLSTQGELSMLEIYLRQVFLPHKKLLPEPG